VNEEKQESFEKPLRLLPSPRAGAAPAIDVPTDPCYCPIQRDIRSRHYFYGILATGVDIQAVYKGEYTYSNAPGRVVALGSVDQAQQQIFMRDRLDL